MCLPASRAVVRGFRFSAYVDLRIEYCRQVMADGSGWRPVRFFLSIWLNRFSLRLTTFCALRFILSLLQLSAVSAGLQSSYLSFDSGIVCVTPFQARFQGYFPFDSSHLQFKLICTTAILTALRPVVSLRPQACLTFCLPLKFKPKTIESVNNLRVQNPKPNQA